MIARIACLLSALDGRLRRLRRSLGRHLSYWP